MHYTSVNGSYLCTVALVKAGADVNELDVNGCSPLHYAAAVQTSHRYDTAYNTALESIQSSPFFNLLHCCLMLKCFIFIMTEQKTDL